MTKNQASLITTRLSLKMAFSLVALLLAVFASGASATINVYQEDFTTTQYNYVLNTTALWNTSTREHAFVADGDFGLQVVDINHPSNNFPH